MNKVLPLTKFDSGSTSCYWLSFNCKNYGFLIFCHKTIITHKQVQRNDVVTRVHNHSYSLIWPTHPEHTVQILLFNRLWVNKTLRFIKNHIAVLYYENFYDSKRIYSLHINKMCVKKELNRFTQSIHFNVTSIHFRFR